MYRTGDLSWSLLVRVPKNRAIVSRPMLSSRFRGSRSTNQMDASVIANAIPPTWIQVVNNICFEKKTGNNNAQTLL